MATRSPLSLLALFLIASAFVSVGYSNEEPTFTQCRVHIEAAIKAGGIAGESESSPSINPLESHVTETVEELPEPPPEPVEPEPEPEVVIEVEAEEEEDEDHHHPVIHHEEEDEDDEEHAAEGSHDHGEEEDDDHHDDEGEIASEEESEEGEEVESAPPAAEEASEEPAADEPVAEEPATEEPAAEEPVAEEPAVEEPLPEPEAQVEEPVQEAEPQQEEPATTEPVVEEEIAAPVEEAPATEEPSQVESPTVAEAVTEEVAEEPVVEEQATEETATEVENPAEGIIEAEPEVRRSREHISRILRLDEDVEGNMLRDTAVINILKDVKKLVENSVRSLESIYKYNDVSNRNFGDPEIFSKPLVLFLGPWSGGKSSIVNYLLGTEFTPNALKTGAEPSATFFQILMYGETEEKLDGTQLAADWTFSGLQKFGQAFIDRLRGKRLPNRILEHVNIVEVPGILEVRKQVDRPYPFNDVVQWFIDRADIIFVVYDPTKLDTGLEHEALFDQLKGRQNQVRVLLNKADSVTQEELLLIQNNLVWNLSPLMASPLPPTLYAGSFWSVPYKPDAPVRLLKAHEENMLSDLRETMDNVVENTIAEARRHAVRVRNHAKMVDCYLTTFFNQKGYFGNKKAVSEDIVENPHAYHIFEGLSTLSNISRYDLPDAEVYKDFFRLHPLYDFKPLAATCSFFRGCPLDKLDTAIAYDLPELVGKYKKRLQAIAAGKAKKAGH